ncbi:hypothetical protein CRI94_07295 [Longibacter salinarum]|uniref:Uncharacterized protein n=1 Tax=Longibacter salinarum TaxID=1850348 RepID=A0A2A8CZN3_9BACT|nr:hypothetical protein [Longibacter salinarum]PEN13858.1 hypothetical protein CRI94_07295 [Longibacter salinarum]
MASTDPALEAAMSLAARRHDIPEPLSEIYIAWNLCFRAYCDRYDRPWPNHRVVPDFVTYLRDKTTVTRDELVHAVDAVIFGLEETTGLAGPLKTALRARVLSDVPSPKAHKEDEGEDEQAFPQQGAALTRVMVAMDQEAFSGGFSSRFRN